MTIYMDMCVLGGAFIDSIVDIWCCKNLEYEKRSHMEKDHMPWLCTKHHETGSSCTNDCRSLMWDCSYENHTIFHNLDNKRYEE